MRAAIAERGNSSIRRAEQHDGSVKQRHGEWFVAPQTGGGAGGVPVVEQHGRILVDKRRLERGNMLEITPLVEHHERSGHFDQPLIP
jgi:hypothetical protein